MKMTEHAEWPHAAAAVTLVRNAFRTAEAFVRWADGAAWVFATLDPAEVKIDADRLDSLRRGMILGYREFVAQMALSSRSFS